MLEIPECQTLARQLNQTVAGRTVLSARANASPHRFAFYFREPERYPGLLTRKTAGKARAFGGHVELEFGDVRLMVSDGTNVRFFSPEARLPAKHQLHIAFSDGSSLVLTVQMYGGIWVFIDGENDNPYAAAALEKPSPLTGAFDRRYFEGLFSSAKPNLSVKAFLATEQRIPGLGNGVLQDILFRAKVHPKTRLSSISDGELESVFQSIKRTLDEMTAGGGRDTEKDLFGNPGGYRTHLSAKTLAHPCPDCGGILSREAYLGGNIYFCADCQPFRG